MPENTNAQIPATENQIELTRPKVGRSFNLLTGHIEGSMNAGHKRIIAYQEVMAGSKIAVSGANLLIQMLTPKTPAFQKLKAVVEVVNVPFKRVWDKYEDFAAQKGGASENKPQVMPNFAGKYFPVIEYPIENSQENYLISKQETTDWRDNIFSCIIPRVGAGETIDSRIGTDPYTAAPNMTALYCRAHVATWNDIFRNKEYDTERTEYITSDTVSDEEWESYTAANSESETDYYFCRTRKDNSYYSNYRAELQGFDSQAPDIIQGDEDEQLINFSEWLHQSAEAMAQASNAQKNAWDVYTSLRGAKKLTEGRVQLLARKTFPISYSTVTQNAYNNNPEIEESFRVLGKQGAFSFTNIDLAWLNGIETKEDGVLLVYMTITADTIYESAVDRTLLNINWKDRYRPDLAKEKNDILMKIETGTPYALDNANDEYEALGFKRRYSEYFKLPCCINGSIMNRGYFQSNPGDVNTVMNLNRLESQHTFQFNEFSATKAQFGTNFSEGRSIINKKHWLDYSDLMVNKNLAIPQETYGNDEGEIVLMGQHQIFYAGETYCIVDMPIEEDAKTNFVKFGEY